MLDSQLHLSDFRTIPINSVFRITYPLDRCQLTLIFFYFLHTVFRSFIYYKNLADRTKILTFLFMAQFLTVLLVTYLSCSLMFPFLLLLSCYYCCYYYCYIYVNWDLKRIIACLHVQNGSHFLDRNR